MPPELNSPFGNGPEDLPPNLSVPDAGALPAPKKTPSPRPTKTKRQPASDPKIDALMAAADALGGPEATPEPSPTPNPSPTEYDPVADQEEAADLDDLGSAPTPLDALMEKADVPGSFKQLNSWHQAILQKTNIMDFEIDGDSIKVKQRIPDPADPSKSQLVDKVYFGKDKQQVEEFIQTTKPETLGAKAASILIQALPVVGIEAMLTSLIGKAVSKTALKGIMKSAAKATSVGLSSVGTSEVATEFEKAAGVPAVIRHEANPLIDFLLPAGMSGMASWISKKASTKTGLMEDLESLRTQQTHMQNEKPLEAAAEGMGIGMTPGQKMKETPGLGVVLDVEGQIRSNTGPASIALDNRVKQQREELATAAQTLASRLRDPESSMNVAAGKPYFGDEGTRTFMKKATGKDVAKLPFDKDLPSALQQTFSQTLAYSRDKIRPFVRQKDYDATQLIAGFETIIKNRFGNIPGVVKKDGSLDLARFQRIAKEQGRDMPGLQAFARSYAHLVNRARQSVSKTGLDAPVGAQNRSVFPADMAQSPVQTHVQAPLAGEGSPAVYMPTAGHDALPPGAHGGQMDFDMLRVRDATGPQTLGPEVRTDTGIQDILPGYSVQNATTAEMARPGPRSAESLAGELNAGSPTSRSQGENFDALANMTDHLQEMSDYTDQMNVKNPFGAALKQAAHEARLMEIEVIEKELRGAGQDFLADKILGFRKTYSENIEALKSFQKVAEKDMPNLAGRILEKQSLKEVDDILAVLSPQQRREMRGAFFEQVVEEMLVRRDGKVSQVSASGVYDKLFGKKAGAMNPEVMKRMFQEDLPLLEKFFTIATRIEDASFATPRSPGWAMTDAAYNIVKGLQYTDFARFGQALGIIFPNQPNAAKYLKTKIDDLVVQNQEMQEKVKRGIRAAERAEKADIPGAAVAAGMAGVGAYHTYDRAERSSKAKDNLEDILRRP